MKNENKAWYKRWSTWLGVFLGLLIIQIVSDLVDGDKEEPKEETPVAEVEMKEKVEVAKEVKEPIGRDGEIRQIIEEIHEDKYMGSEIVEIEVNENLGLNDGSYVVLAHFSFTRANSAEKTLNFISKYGEDLAARLAETEDVSAVTVFYEAPRFIEKGNVAKFAYKRSGEVMVLDNEFIAAELK